MGVFSVVGVGHGLVIAVHTVRLSIYSTVSIVSASVCIKLIYVSAISCSHWLCSVILFAHFSTYWLGSVISPSSASLCIFCCNSSTHVVTWRIDSQGSRSCCRHLHFGAIRYSIVHVRFLAVFTGLWGSTSPCRIFNCSRAYLGSTFSFPGNNILHGGKHPWCYGLCSPILRFQDCRGKLAAFISSIENPD